MQSHYICVFFYCKPKEQSDHEMSTSRLVLSDRNRIFGKFQFLNKYFQFQNRHQILFKFILNFPFHSIRSGGQDPGPASEQYSLKDIGCHIYSSSMKMNAKQIGHHDQSNLLNKFSRVHKQYCARHSSLHCLT